MADNPILKPKLMNTSTDDSKSRLKNSSPQIQSSEADIQRACIDWLNTIPGITVWRRNVGAVTVRKSDASMQFGIKPIKSRFIRYGVPGEGDIDGIGPQGVRISIECKAGDNQPSEEQRAWMGMISRYGGIVFWVNSLNQCQVELRDEFLKRGWPWRKEWEC